jgi:hypothetical protein
MTPTSPTWGDVENFLGADGWTQTRPGQRGGRRQSHIFYEKLLPDGRVLQTHISHDRGATISAGRFGSILREQLEVSRREFWDAIRSGNPVARPVPVDEEKPPEHEAWVIRVLVENLHMTAEEIEGLSVEEGQALVHKYWSRPR